jgi:hypothetical protein
MIVDDRHREAREIRSVPDERVNLTGEQINTGQQTDSALAFIS